MSLGNNRIKELIKDANFSELFFELGWDNVPLNQSVNIKIKNDEFNFKALKQKRGFVAYLYEAESADKFPDRQTGLKIENKISRNSAEHILIFTDRERTKQIWQWSKREANTPVRISRETFSKGMSGERLAQKLKNLFFSIDEEENLTITDVARRNDTLFRERITRRFYDYFRDEHRIFSRQIEGIDNEQERDWYASLTLNRLMFVYFIQYKEFLDGDPKYLRTKLRQTQTEIGNDMFYSFYKTFLVRFFHDALGEPNHSPELVAMVGKIPYLNGGLFERHKIETDNDIQIKDDAFIRVFDFFDRYDWHLDDRPLHNDNEINPEVLGYIFEKFINQKQMGAYYTKEDITEYISKNTIIPFLFDRVKEKVSIAFESYDGIWQIIWENPDRYIYDSVKKGVIDDEGNETEIPSDIKVGINDVSQRANWNSTIDDDDFGLPTETWREYISRRERCLDIRQKLKNGEIYDINDFITYNLDIRRFAVDVIFTAESHDLVKAFYHAIAGRIPERSNDKFEKGVAVLDPTCGSGAFLFAALQILEPLLEACLDRMEDFVEDEDFLRPNSAKFSAFRRVLDEIEKHPNRRYYVLKQIIVNNLFGVDIMPDAVEICKLRLFLKLVAQVDADPNHKNYGLEPLPDIDFNIRAGNTLVGFANEKEVYQAFQGAEQQRLAFDDRADEFKWKAGETARIYEQFRLQQIKEGGEVTADDKANLQAKLFELSDELNRFIAHEYGIDEIKYPQNFVQFLKSHQPFHWYSEFYSIIADGGFDVIIGNPPYVEYSKIRSIYSILPNTLNTIDCGNLYAFIMERSLLILRESGKLGFIVPISLTCTQRMATLQTILTGNSSNLWNSIYAERPDKLFDGAEVLLTISLLSKNQKPNCEIWTTGLRKWKSEERATLFDLTNYNLLPKRLRTYILPKLSSQIETSILKKFWDDNTILANELRSSSKDKIFYRIGGGRYWKVFTTFQPKFILNGKESISSRENYLYFDNSEIRDIGVTVLSSTLFYWYFVLTTNGRDLNPSDLKFFSLSISSIEKNNKAKLKELCLKLMSSYRQNRQEKEKFSQQTGRIIYEEFYPRISKSIIDEIDRVLANHYGFTDEELDFIINYDIKYRIGRED